MNASITQQYNIGAVARLTQIHPETIRVWERRYQLVVPHRSQTGRRMYSEDDISRLLIVKKLTELGHAVSGLAKLSNEKLQERLTASHSREISSPQTAAICRVLFADEPLKIRLGHEVGMYSDIKVLDNPTGGKPATPDVLIVGVATINSDTLADLQSEAAKTECNSIIAVYSFGQPSALKQLTQAGIICLKNPVGASDLRDACKSAATGTTSVNSDVVEIPSRRFSEQQLATVATLKGSIACECPNHLAELIINLCAFEQYSSDCENSNPRDAIIHSQLNSATAQARAILEESLAKLIEIEGIQI